MTDGWKDARMPRYRSSDASEKSKSGANTVLDEVRGKDSRRSRRSRNLWAICKSSVDSSRLSIVPSQLLNSDCDSLEDLFAKNVRFVVMSCRRCRRTSKLSSISVSACIAACLAPAGTTHQWFAGKALRAFRAIPSAEEKLSDRANRRSLWRASKGMRR